MALVQSCWEECLLLSIWLAVYQISPPPRNTSHAVIREGGGGVSATYYSPLPGKIGVPEVTHLVTSVTQGDYTVEEKSLPSLFKISKLVLYNLIGIVEPIWAITDT